MNNLNSILIEGNLVDDPRTRQTPDGKTVCSFTLVSTRYYKTQAGFGKKETYVDIETEGKLAEACGRGKKGRGVRVVGRIAHDKCLGKDGETLCIHNRLIVVAEHVEFRPMVEKPNFTEEEIESFAENDETVEAEEQAEVV